MSLTGGLDVGARSVKVALLSHQGSKSTVLARALIQIRGRRDPRAATQEGWRQVLAEAGLSARDVDSIASMGAASRGDNRVGPSCGHAGQARRFERISRSSTAVFVDRTGSSLARDEGVWPN